MAGICLPRTPPSCCSSGLGSWEVPRRRSKLTPSGPEAPRQAACPRPPSPWHQGVPALSLARHPPAPTRAQHDSLAPLGEPAPSQHPSLLFTPHCAHRQAPATPTPTRRREGVPMAPLPPHTLSSLAAHLPGAGEQQMPPSQRCRAQRPSPASQARGSRPAAAGAPHPGRGPTAGRPPTPPTRAEDRCPGRPVPPPGLQRPVSESVGGPLSGGLRPGGQGLRPPGEGPGPRRPAPRGAWRAPGRPRAQGRRRRGRGSRASSPPTRPAPSSRSPRPPPAGPQAPFRAPSLSLVTSSNGGRRPSGVG